MLPIEAVGDKSSSKARGPLRRSSRQIARDQMGAPDDPMRVVRWVLDSPDLSPAMIQENLLRGDDPDHFVQGRLTAPIAPDVQAHKRSDRSPIPSLNAPAPVFRSVSSTAAKGRTGPSGQSIGQELRSMARAVPAFFNDGPRGVSHPSASSMLPRGCARQ